MQPKGVISLVTLKGETSGVPYSSIGILVVGPTELHVQNGLTGFSDELLVSDKLCLGGTIDIKIKV